MGLISKRDEQKKKRERHRERIENRSYNDGVASGVLKGVRPALQTPFLVTRTWVCMSMWVLKNPAYETEKYFQIKCVFEV